MHLSKKELKDLNKLFITLIFGAALVIFLLSFIGSFNFWRALKNAVIVLLILGILYFTFRRFIKTNDEKLIEQSGISETDEMNLEQFQKFVLDYMAINEFEIDYSQNIIVKNRDHSFVLKALQPSNDIDAEYIVDIREAVRYYEADTGIIVSNGNFSRQAETLAKKSNVLLIDRDILVDDLVKRK